MRHRIIGCAMAGSLLALAAASQPVAAQDAGDPSSAPSQPAVKPIDQLDNLAGELGIVNERVAEADDLLQQIDAGGGYLVSDGLILTVMTAEQLSNAIAERLFLEGTGEVSGEAVARDVRNTIAGNPRMVASLRAARTSDLARIAVIERQLEHLRNTITTRPGPQLGSKCSLPHGWRIDVAGRGSSNIVADASGNVSGANITSGKASKSGNRLTITWFSRGGGFEIGGRYIATLDSLCNGSGELVLDIVPDGAGDLGIRGGPITLTSLGAGGPS